MGLPSSAAVSNRALRHDLEGADALLSQMQADTLLADKAFDADERVIEPLLAAGKKSSSFRPRRIESCNASRQRIVQGAPPHGEFYCKLISSDCDSI